MPKATKGREPPYPAATDVGSARFPLDLGRIEQSHTWVLAPAELRPWLQFVWARSWRQLPSGSYPNDDAVIAAHLGMPLALFRKHRKILLRGWWQASDGRLYHNTIAELVTERLKEREAWRKRQGSHRGVTGDVTRESHESHVRSGSGSGSGGGAVPIRSGLVTPSRAGATTPPDQTAWDKNAGTKPGRWDATDQGIVDHGKAIGVLPKVGEDMLVYKRRLHDADGRRLRGEAIATDHEDEPPPSDTAQALTNEEARARLQAIAQELATKKGPQRL